MSAQADAAQQTAAHPNITRFIFRPFSFYPCFDIAGIRIAARTLPSFRRGTVPSRATGRTHPQGHAVILAKMNPLAQEQLPVPSCRWP